MEDPIKKVMNEILRRDYGGCNPATDNPCVLKARVRDKKIEVFCVGKWRGVRGYWHHSNRVPSMKIQKEVIASIRINTGLTFDGKDIKLKWEEVE